MPAIDLSTIDNPDQKAIPRLIGARITAPRSVDATYLWYLPLGAPNLANLEDRKSLADGDSVTEVLDQHLVPFTDIGTRTETAFPSFSAGNANSQHWIDAALPMKECLGGTPGGS